MRTQPRQLLSRFFDLDTSSGVRLAGLDGLRGIAAAMVFVSHVYQYSNHPGFAFMTPLIRYAGQGGVILFFVLSGFLMALPWLLRRSGRPDPSVATFAKRRILRIVPAYYVSVFALWVGAQLFNYSQDAGTLLYQLVFLPIVGSGALTAVYWTLQTEAFFYVLVPPLARLTRRSKWLAVVLAGVVSASYFSAVLALVDDAHTRHILLKQTPFYLLVFVLGMFTASLWVTGSDWMARRGRYLIVTALIGYAAISSIAVAFIDDGRDQTSNNIMNVLLAPFAALLILAVARGSGPLFRSVPARFLGAISYSWYLWHLVIIMRLPLSDSIKGNFVVLFVATTAVSLVVATGSFLLVERPFLLLSRGINPFREWLARLKPVDVTASSEGDEVRLRQAE